MSAPLNTIILYAKDPKKSADFYRRFFGFATSGEIVEGLVELKSQSGISLLIHQAAKGVTLGQVGVKLMFDVEDIDAFKAVSAAYGLEFGPTHQANGYSFANAKDPDKNSISISSRAFKRKA